jgi:hypothetical protein
MHVTAIYTINTSNWFLLVFTCRKLNEFRAISFYVFKKLKYFEKKNLIYRRSSIAHGFRLSSCEENVNR